MYQDNRLFVLHFPREDGPAADLLIEHFRAHEALSRDFEITLDLLSRNAFIPLKAAMGKMVAVELVQAPRVAPRWFNGYVTQFAHTGTDGGFARYRMVLSPWTAMLSRHSDHRIFQNQTLTTTLEQIFSAYGEFADYEFRLNGPIPAETFRVQWETDANYFNRRCEDKGWYYWFEHQKSGHRLVIGNDSTVSRAIDGLVPIRFHNDRGVEWDDVIDRWEAQRTLMPAKVCLRSFDFKQPSRRLEVSLDTINQQGDVAPYEVYEYPGVYAFHDQHTGELLAKLRMEEIEAHAKLFNGEGNCRRIQPGRWFEMTEHYECSIGEPEDARFFVIEVEHTGGNNYLHGHDERAKYRNSFTALRRKIPWRPGRQANSRAVIMPGVQMARVVGPPGEDVWCDEYGRVWIEFPWDRRNFGDMRASCPVQVNYPIGGGQMGGVFLPRVGQMVAIEFLGGNPDLPVVMGRFYNDDNMPPWQLPASKYQMGFMSRSIFGGNDTELANALRFDDTPGQEELWTHAQKDRRDETENDVFRQIGQNMFSQIGGSLFSTVMGSVMKAVMGNRSKSVSGNEQTHVQMNRDEQVSQNETLSIGKDRSMKVGGNKSLEVDKDKSVKVKGNHSIQVDKDKHIQVGQSMKIVVQDELVIQVGQSTLAMKSDGTVTMNGVKIGVAGSGSVKVNGAVVTIN